MRTIAPIVPWNDRGDQPLVRRQDPETCHCGKPALYRHPTQHNIGYCSDHKAEAVKVTTGTRHRSER
jgi:hypothetical protein